MNTHNHPYVYVHFSRFLLHFLLLLRKENQQSEEGIWFISLQSHLISTVNLYASKYFVALGSFFLPVYYWPFSMRTAFCPFSSCSDSWNPQMWFGTPCFCSRSLFVRLTFASMLIPSYIHTPISSRKNSVFVCISSQKAHHQHQY